MRNIVSDFVNIGEFIELKKCESLKTVQNFKLLKR